MKHAGTASIAALHSLLAELRALGGLVERKPGTFYRRGSAFLHFHEDPAGLFADVKLGGKQFSRLPVNTTAEREALLAAVYIALRLAPVKQPNDASAQPSAAFVSDSGVRSNEQSASNIKP